MALRSGAPVVPVGLVGTRDVQPPDSKRLAPGAGRRALRRRRCDFSHLADQERSARVLREITETIREQVQLLSGQEYVDTYGSSVKLAG